MKQGNPSDGRRKAVWLVLDAAGYEITRRCVEAGVCPALSAIREQGYLGPCNPPQPNCETPPALRALFSGDGPRESGVWGYRMPQYGSRPERSVSGFSVPLRGAQSIWSDLEQRGASYTLFNTAFRRDPVWRGRARHFDLILDAYRNYKPLWDWIVADADRETLRFGRIPLQIRSREGRTELYKRSRLLACLQPGEIQPVRPSRKFAGLAYRTDSHLFLLSSAPTHLRAAKPIRRAGFGELPESIHHGNLFRFGRDRGGLSVEEEMGLSRYVNAQMGELVLGAFKRYSSTLTIAYFPLIDELCHVYLDQIEQLWPEGRAAELLRRSYGLLDSYIARIMSGLDENTLLILSSDHGQMPYRRVLHVNELFAGAGLVRISGGGYDLRRSLLYYHPSNCGQVLLNRRAAGGSSRAELAARVLRCLERANGEFGAGIAHLEGGQQDPYLLFLYPCSDTHISGRRQRNAEIMDTDRKGGQHLSPLSGNVWMQSLIGLWSPGGISFPAEEVPKRSTEVKDFLLRFLFDT